MPNLVDIKSIKTLRDDILLVNIPKREIEGESSIYYAEQDEDQIQYFKTIAIGPDTIHVKVGDIVICDWRRLTPPQNGIIGGKTREYGVTSEKEVLAIVDQVEK